MGPNLRLVNVEHCKGFRMSPWRRRASDLLGWFALMSLAALLGVGCWLAVVLLFVLGG